PYARARWSDVRLSRVFAPTVVGGPAWPVAAHANPSITVSSARVGSTAKLPATVRHTLQLTAGASDEKVSVSVSPPGKVTLSGVPAPPPSAQTGPAVRACPGEWRRCHDPCPFGPLPDDQLLA